MSESKALATLIDRGWYAATDKSGLDVVEAVGPEAIYRLGFVNGLQTVLIASSDPVERELLTEALGQAQELIELEASGR